MRPEHFYSGNPDSFVNPFSAEISFNEAGAFLLRKSFSYHFFHYDIPSFNEAGAFLLRKSVLLGLGVEDGVLASMRPEHFYSGNLAAEMGYEIEIFASMRPEHFYSGNLRCRQSRLCMSPCFNEAGAFLLRKSGPLAKTWGRCVCFNEAGAFLLRKSSFSDDVAGLHVWLQ